jgi:hypothetical protein
MEKSFLSRSQLSETINSVRSRRKRLVDKMRAKRNTLCLMEISRGMAEILEYQKLNDELRQVKIYEAELVYLKNML